MATEPLPVVEPQAQISPFGRILGMFFSPKATFEDIVRKPNWILPAALMILFSLGATIALNQHFNLREYMSQQIEKSPRSAQLSPEQKQQQIEMGSKYAPTMAYVFGVPTPLVALLLISLVLMGAYNLLGGANVSYKTSLAVVAHSFVPSLLATILFVAVLFLKPIGMFDLDNPVATNAAALLPDDSAKWLVTLGKNIDLFAFWTLVLIAIGFAGANPKKLKGGKSFTIVLACFVIYIVIRVGIAFAFS